MPAGLTGPGPAPAAGPDRAARLTAWVSGRVQGVGFRAWVRSRAVRLRLAGSVRNLDDGRVGIVAEGPPAACRELLAMLSGEDAPGEVTGVRHQWSAARGDLGSFAEL